MAVPHVAVRTDTLWRLYGDRRSRPTLGRWPAEWRRVEIWAPLLVSESYVSRPSDFQVQSVGKSMPDRHILSRLWAVNCPVRAPVGRSLRLSVGRSVPPAVSRSVGRSVGIPQQLPPSTPESDGELADAIAWTATLGDKEWNHRVPNFDRTVG